jgi:hypothetical protein
MPKKFEFFLLSMFFVLLLLSFLKIHVKIQTTMLGYEIGRLKGEEFLLLKKRSQLMMELAQLTTKDSLSLLIEKK